jgi:uncharacterized damage-inducible protein DinB
VGRAQIELFASLIRDAFEHTESDPWRGHSFAANLASVPASMFSVLPPGGSRSIGLIAWHMGASSYMYANSMFSDGSLTWDQLATEGRAKMADHAAFLDWIGAANQMLVDAVLRLEDDSDLDGPQKTHWGEPHSTRQILRAMIEHHYYHAGEINHIRAVLQGNDTFPGGPDD